MAIDFSIEPFFDDYNEDNKFHRILFRPGYAVQARELTQLQTILQNQISRHGDHIFKEGAMVIPGQISYDLNLKYIKLVQSTSINYDIVLSTLKGNDIKNAAGLTAKVIEYALAEGNDPPTLFLRYLNTVQDNNGNNVREFSSDDILSPVDTTLGTGLNVTVADVEEFFGNASSASVQRGVFYIKKNFVLVPEQLIILDKYSNTPSYRVGLQAVESILYPEEDENLLDNALGSPNYSAPGAARYVIDLQLTKLPIERTAGVITANEDDDFIDLLRLDAGKLLFKIDRTQYAELEKTLARRTYDESGDYSLSPFGIQVREYRNNFRGPWTGNRAYIQGDIVTHRPSNTLTTYHFVATKNASSGSSAPSFISNNVIPDKVVDGSQTWEHVPQPKFNQGIHSFPASLTDVTKDFTVNDHLRLNAMMLLGIEAGKAYVRGYEIEKLATEYVPTFKSRDVPAGSAYLKEYFGFVPPANGGDEAIFAAALPAITDSASSDKVTSIDVSVGNYVIVQNTFFLPDIKNCTKINLHSAAIASNGGVGSVVTTGASSTLIGTARVRGFEKHETGTYKLFLFDIVMNFGKTFSDVKSVYNAADKFKCNLVLENSKAVIKEPGLNSAIFSLPDYAIREIKDVTHTAVISQTSTGVLNGGGTGVNSVTFSAPAGYTYESTLDDDNYILVSNAVNTTASPNIPAGTILTGSNFVYSRNQANTTLTITTSTSGGITNISYTLFATVKRSLTGSNAGATAQTKKQIEDETQTLTASATALNASTITTGGTYTIVAVGNTSFTSLGAPSNTVGVVFKATANGPVGTTGTVKATIPNEIVLNRGYVTRIVSVLMDNRGFVINGAANTSPTYNTNITNRYIFNSNQDITSVKRSSIILAAGAEAPTGPIQIKYEYAADVGTNPGGFYGVGSYSYANSNISYEEIGTVSSFQLRDCIDFRPTEEVSGFKEKYFPKFGSTASITYNHYLSRVDNISLSSAGQFINNRGIPSISAVEPTIPNNCMKLASINIEPYTFNRDNKIGALVNRVENKRYTMRDIGKLERRIQDLEYYTSLTLAELETKNMQIVDSEGLDRYQNGFLVDSFDGQGVGNAASDDWNASVDMQKKELRPFFAQKQVALLENISSTTKDTYKVSGDLVTLPYTQVEVAWAKQSKASVEVPVNPYSIASYKGIMGLNPWSDTWFSTHYRPDIIVNDESQYNAIVQKAEQSGILGTVWNSWQTAFSSTRSMGSRMESLGQWSKLDTSILNAENNGGTFWRNRATFTTEELDFIGNTNRNIFSAQANQVAGSRVVTIETSAVETTSTRTGTRSFITDKVDSRVVEDRVVDTQIVPFIRPRSVLFVGYGFKPSTKLYSYFDNISVDQYITPATKIAVTPITGAASVFDVERNAGTAVEDAPRKVYYNNGSLVDGTVNLTNNSATVTGVATEFMSDLEVGDEINFGDSSTNKVIYKVATKTSNTQFTMDKAWQGATVTDVSIRAIGPTHNNNQEVEVAFNHGEVITELNASNQPTGVTAIVVAQETVGNTVVLHLMNIRGGQFTFNSNYTLRGEYNNAITNAVPRVKFAGYYGMTAAGYSINTTNPLTVNEGAALISSATGVVAGIFKIPSNPVLRFRTGTREFKLSDVFSTDIVQRTEQELTSGGAFYEANGIVEVKQRTIVSTRTADIVSEQVSDTNTIVTTADRLTRDTGWFDPLAQTFMVQEDGGAFITSVDLYFSSKDAKIPVRIEIREVVNGYPSSKVLPFSRVEKKAADVKISTDATLATTFTFVSPIYLQNGTEYSLVVLSDSDYYKIWCSETGTLQILPGGSRGAAITSQPFNGVMFKSQNASTWTADQTQDMKFTIRRASFSSTSAKLELVPPKLGFTSLDFNPFNFIAGTTADPKPKCRVTHRNHNMIVGDKVVFIAGQTINSINSIPASNIFRSTGHVIQSVELDSYVVDFSLGPDGNALEVTTPITSNATGKTGGGFIQASEHYAYQTAMIDIAEVIPPGTSVSYELTSVNSNGDVFANTLVNKENYDFFDERVIPAEINLGTSQNYPSRGLKLVATLNPASGSNSVSPVIDLGRLAMTTVSNKIDSPTLAIIDNDFDRFLIGTTEIGNEASSKPLRLLDNPLGRDTIFIDSLTQGTLYNNVNNNIDSGDVIEFVYSNTTADQTRYMIVVEKSFDTILDSNGDVAQQRLLLKLESMNSLSMDETGVGQTVTVTWLSHFKSEYAPIGGSTHSKYVTKKINFSRPSEMLRIMFAAVIPNDAEVEIYYKTGSGVAGDFIASRYYKATPSSYTKSETDFTEVTANVENLAPFDSVIVKLVMKSINKGKIPRIKDFRVIAVA